MANYLVTGAAGFIGSALAKTLVNDGNKVITIDNLSTGFENNIPEGVLFIKGDCGDPTTYELIPEDVKFDAIFHIAGQSSGEISFDDPIYDIRSNAESTLLLLKFALNNGCSRFIFASTMSVYGPKSDHPISESEDCQPHSFYGVAKLASEHYLRIYEQYGVRSTALRLFNVYGPGQNLENLRQGMVSIFLAQMLNDGHIHVKGAPDRYRDFVFISDVVKTFISCLGNEKSFGEIVNVGTGRRTSVGELVERLIGADGRKITVEYSGSTSGDIHGIYADHRKYDSIFGKFKPVGFDEGIKTLVDGAQR